MQTKRRGFSTFKEVWGLILGADLPDNIRMFSQTCSSDRAGFKRTHSNMLDRAFMKIQAFVRKITVSTSYV